MKEGIRECGELSDCITGQLCKVGEKEVGTESVVLQCNSKRTCQLTEKSLSPCHPSEEAGVIELSLEM